MSLLNESLLKTDPLGQGDDEQQGLFKSAQDAFEDIMRPRGIKTPDQVVAQAGSSWRDQLKALETATPQQKAAPVQQSSGGGWRDQLRALEQPAPEEQGNFSRGLSVSGKQLKQTAYGTAALIGDTVGADSLKEWGLKGYKAAEEEVKAISKETDSFTTAVEKGELGKWFSYSSGYLLGQVAEMGAASVAGAVAGSLVAPGAGTAAGAITGAIEKGAVQAGVRGFVGKMIDKQAADAAERMVKAGVAKEIAEKAAVEAATKSVYRTIGATTANTFLNATGELGSIYGEAVEEALAKGEDYSLGRVWLAGLAATAVDSWADSKALGKFVGAFGGDKAIKGIAMEALKGGFREGMTEGVQTVIERWGADKDLASKEAFKEYIDSAAVGVLGGGIAGGTSGAINKVFKPEDGSKAVDTSAGKQDLADQPGQKDLSTTLPEGARAISKQELLDTLGNADAMAYLYSTGDKDQKNAIIKALDRAGTDFRERFDQAVGREDNIRAGEAMLAQEPAFVETLRNSIDTFGSTLNVNQTGRRVARPARQMTEAEQLKQLDEANEALYGNLTTTPPSAPAPAPAAPPVMAAAPTVPANAAPEAPADVQTGIPNLPPLQAPAAQTSEAQAQTSTVQTQASEAPAPATAPTPTQSWIDKAASAAQDYAEKSGKEGEPKDLLAQAYSTYLLYGAREGKRQLAELSNDPNFKALGDTVESLHLKLKEQASKFRRKNPAPGSKAQEAKGELKEAVANLFDVVAETTGAKLNITGQKYTAADLPAAISKVMQALVKLGYVKFKDITAELMRRMRASKDWAPLADSVTEQMLRDAYNALPQFPGKEAAAAEPSGPASLRAMLKDLFDAEQRTQETDAYVALELRSSTKEQRADAQKRVDARESAIKRLRSALEGNIAALTDAQKKSELSSRLAEIDSMPDDMKSAILSDVVGELEGKSAPKRDAAKTKPVEQPQSGSRTQEPAARMRASGPVYRSEVADEEAADKAAPAKQEKKPAKPAESQTVTREIQGRINKLDLGKERTKAQNLLDKGKYDEAEAVVNAVYEEKSKANKTLLAGARRRVELLGTAKSKFGIDDGAVFPTRAGNDPRPRTVSQMLEELLSGEPTANNIETADRLIKFEATRIMRSLLKQGYAKAAQRVFDVFDLGYAKVSESMARLRQGEIQFADEEDDRTFSRVRDPNARPISDRQLQAYPGLSKWISGMEKKSMQVAAKYDLGTKTREELVALDKAWSNLLSIPRQQLPLSLPTQDMTSRQRKLDDRIARIVADATGSKMLSSGIERLRAKIADLDERIAEMDRVAEEGGPSFRVSTRPDEKRGLFGIFDDTQYARDDQGFRPDRANTDRDDLVYERSKLVEELRIASSEGPKGKAMRFDKALEDIKDKIINAAQASVQTGMSFTEASEVVQRYMDILNYSDPTKQADLKVREEKNALIAQGYTPSEAEQLAEEKFGWMRGYKQSMDGENRDIATSLTQDMFQEAEVVERLVAGEITPNEALRQSSNLDPDNVIRDAMYALAKQIADPKLLKAEREAKLRQASSWIAKNMREGTMTFRQVQDAFRFNGLDMPLWLVNNSMLAMHTSMLEYSKQMGGGYAPREFWLRSMDQALRFNPGYLNDGTFTDAEVLMYEEWKARQERLLERRNPERITNARDPDVAFNGMLFMKYSLAEMRDPNLIQNERDRLMIKNMVADPVQAWHRDLSLANKLRPELVSRLFSEGMFDADWTSHAEWRIRQDAADRKKAEMIERSQFYLGLPQMEGLSPEQIDKIKLDLINGDIQSADQVMLTATEMRISEQMGGERRIDPETGEIIDPAEQYKADYIDSLAAKDEVMLAVDGTFGSEAQRNQVAEDMRQGDIEEMADEDANTNEEAAVEEDTRTDEERTREDDASRFKRGFFSGVLTNAVVQAHVSRITAKWKGAPQIVVLQNVNQLPDGVRERIIKKLGSEMDAKGLFDGNTGIVYLFSDHITSEADVEFTLFHEVDGHLGLRAFFGAKFDAFLENMYRIYPAVRKQADELIANGMPRLEAIDEVMSDMAASESQKASSAVKTWVGKIAAWLREAGFGKVADWIASVSTAEAAFYLQQARDYARNGGVRSFNGAPGVLRLRQAQHERLYEMFSIRDGKTTGYARLNPVTQTWAVFKADADDIRNGYTSMVVGEYEQVLDMMRRGGKVEFRKRSGAYVEDKLPGDMPKLTEITNVTGMKRWMRNLITQYQNEFKPIFDVVDRLREMGRLTERMDVKTALMLYERKTGAIIDIFRRKYVTPIEKLIKEASEQGADYGTINTFLLARHARERNEQIARINPGMPDKGSGMYTEDAENFLAEVATKPYAEALNEIGRLTDQMSQEKLRYLLNTGMITAKQYQAMQVYRNYVNLSGQNDKLDKFEDISRLVGTKFNVKGKEARAYGRSDAASDILANTILGMESALIRGQKNMVAQKLLAMLEANYDPNFATINEISYKRQIGEDGMVMEVEDTDYITRKDVMVAKVNGIPVTIRFKDATPGSFAEAIHGSVYPPQSGDLVEAVGKFNQIMGQMLTTWNPAWVAINFVRDTQTLYFNAAADGRITRAQAAQMVKMLPKAIKTAYYMAMVESGRQTNITPDPEMVRAYNEMKRAGGLTSFLNRKDLENQVTEIEKALGERNKLQKAGDKVKSILDIMEFMTLPAEIAPRLAAYKVTRDGGFTQDQAAVFSGEITVNFNMRGANKNIRKLFLFFNPAIQGSAKLVSLIRDNPKLAAAYAMAWIGLGAAVNLIGRALSDDDEDGRNQIDKVPVYKRATSMVLIPDTPFGAIPIAYGWNAFYSLGHFALDTALGIQPPLESAKRIAKTAIEAFSPLGTAGLDSKSFAGTVLKGAAPTALLPMVEFVMNENRFGAPIRMSDQFGAPKPDSEMAFRSVSPISKAIAQGLNEVTGGNRARSGAIDVNPSTIDFMISSYLPGLINEAYKGSSVAARVARGEEVKNVPMPLVDRFTAKVPEGYDAGAFRRAKEMIDQRYAEYIAFPDKRDEIRKESPGLMRAHAVTASTAQEVRKLRSVLTEIENNPRFSEKERVERLNLTKEREKQLYNRAVKAVMEAGPEFKDAVMASD